MVVVVDFRIAARSIGSIMVVDEVIPYIERLNHIKQIQRTRGKLYHGKLYQAKQIQENKGATDIDAIFMEEHMKELDDELTRLLDGVILGKR